jgi:hypothetical protein
MDSTAGLIMNAFCFINSFYIMAEHFALIDGCCMEFFWRAVGTAADFKIYHDWTALLMEVKKKLLKFY